MYEILNFRMLTSPGARNFVLKLSQQRSTLLRYSLVRQASKQPALTAINGARFHGSVRSANSEYL